MALCGVNHTSLRAGACVVCVATVDALLSFVEVTPNVFLFLLFLTTLAAAARLQLVAGGLAVSADPSLSTSHIRIYPLSRGYPTLLLPVHSSLHFRLWRLFSPSALFQGFHPRRSRKPSAPPQCNQQQQELLLLLSQHILGGLPYVSMFGGLTCAVRVRLFNSSSTRGERRGEERPLPLTSHPL